MRNPHILSCVVLTLLIPVTTFAYGKRPIGATKPMSRTSTTGVFMDRQIWLPSTWTVKEEKEKLTFRKPSPDGKRESVVTLTLIPRDQCAYGLIRMRALKAWGGTNLEQSQGRVQALTFGSSKFRGFTWVEPSTWKGDQHWCVGQDLKNALELTAPVGDTELNTFIKNDLLLQLVVRSGRSVLPWPAASQYSSSSSSSY